MPHNERARFQAPTGFRTPTGDELFQPRDQYRVPRTNLVTGDTGPQVLPTAAPQGGGLPLVSVNGRPLGEAVMTGLRNIGEAGTFTAGFVPPNEAGSTPATPSATPAAVGLRPPESRFTRSVEAAPATFAGDFEDFARQYQGTTADGRPAIEGFRTIRRPGETPLLTNLTGERLDAALQQPQTFTAPVAPITATTGGTTPQGEQSQTFNPAAEGPGFRRTVVTGQDERGLPTTQTTDISGSDLNRLGARLAENTAGQPEQPRTYEQVLSGLRTPRTLAGVALASNLARSISRDERNAFNARQNLGLRGRQEARLDRELGRKDAQLEINQQLADTQAATALTNARKVATELGTEFEGVFEERPIDPSNPLLGTTKTLTGFQTKGKGAGLPSFIPLEDLEAYREALRVNADSPSAIEAIKNEFKASYTSQPG